MSELTQYGLPGIVIAGLCWFVVNIMKQHKDERKEWKQTTEKQFDEQNKSSNAVTNALSRLNTLIETMKK